jgi:hypothetical protein
MPRKSPFIIQLSDKEKEELTKRAGKYTLPYILVIRAKIILLASEGLENEQIASALIHEEKLSADGANASLNSAVLILPCMLNKMVLLPP